MWLLLLSLSSSSGALLKLRSAVVAKETNRPDHTGLPLRCGEGFNWTVLFFVLFLFFPLSVGPTSKGTGMSVLRD